MAWGLQKGDVLRVIVPEFRNSKDAAFAIAQAMWSKHKPVAMFTTERAQNVRHFRDHLDADGRIYADGASRNVDFILNQMSYGHPKLVVIEGHCPNRDELEQLQERARREEAIIVIVTQASRKLGAEEFAAHLADKLPPEESIDELP